MKANKIFGALMIFSLSFSACKKDSSEIALPTPAEAPLAERLAAAAFKVSAEKPLSVVDVFNKKSKQFVYDDKDRLIAIKESDGKVSSFIYDRLNRLERINISNELLDALYTSALVFEYSGKNLKPDAVSEYKVSSDQRLLFLKSTLFGYDEKQNKVSEVEVGPNANAVAGIFISRKFYYNENGNCTKMQELKGGKIEKELTYTEFDLHPSFNVSVAALQFLPGAIIQKNNPAKMFQRLSNGFYMEHQITYEFDHMGFPVLIKDDLDESVISIKYSVVPF